MCPVHAVIRERKRQEKLQKQKMGEVLDLDQEWLKVGLKSSFLENSDAPIFPPHAPPRLLSSSFTCWCLHQFGAAWLCNVLVLVPHTPAGA